MFFADAARHIARVANEGTITAGNTFASALGNLTLDTALDGTVTIALEGANAVAREFGTLKLPAQPVLSPALRARRREVAQTVGVTIGHALKTK
jgi:hypothetical protein